MSYSKALLDAMEIVGQIPLPDDAGARLQALESQVTPKEQDMFGELWEAFLAAGGDESFLLHDD